jgi:hypothetical protein
MCKLRFARILQRFGHAHSQARPQIVVQERGRRREPIAWLAWLEARKGCGSNERIAEAG